MLACSGSAANRAIMQPTITVSVSPTSATLAAGGTQAFTATVQGAADTDVIWQVNQVTGGDSSTGNRKKKE